MTTLDTCRLNDMIPMRADVHQLFDAFEVGIDVHVCPTILPLKLCLTVV